MISDFRLYAHQAYFDLAEPQLCQLSLFTSDPNYGALLDSRDIGGSSVQWTPQDPTSHQPTGFLTQHMSIWTSREHQKARYLALALEETCVHGEADPEVLAPEQPEQPPRIPMMFWGSTGLDRWLTKMHVNTGHVPGSQMAHCLRAAGYAKHTVVRSRQLKCDVCDKFKRTAPARPTKNDDGA